MPVRSAGVVLTLLLSVVAIVLSVLAYRAAKTANRIALDAGEDVTWDPAWIDHGLLEVTNLSQTTTAHEVAIRVIVTGVESESAHVRDVGPRLKAGIQLPRSVDRARRDREELIAAQEKSALVPLSQREEYPEVMEAPWSIEARRNSYEVHVEVLWKTAGGYDRRWVRASCMTTISNG